MVSEKYNPEKVEKRWQKAWLRAKIFKAPDFPKKTKAYVLDMFPYPSGEGLHVGHPEGYTASDIYTRFLRMQGQEVLHPMGWDAFGLPAENYALKTGTPPAETLKKNIKNFKKQIQALGFSYDWSREINTTDPNYYQWTQWIFVQLFKRGLAYEAFAPINWCPKDKTGLANEEVAGGKCERCGTEVVRKNIRQWLVKITDSKYIERLLKDLDKLDWPESIKHLQRNWIGKSEGALVDFELVTKNQEPADKFKVRSMKSPVIRVFTTRPDTLFGATYLVLSPEHPLVEAVTTLENRKAVEDYQKQAAKKSDLDRTDLAKEKTGVFTGGYAINPVNNEKIPIWIADYVLSSYGTGAIMAVPAHDERDFEFAKKFKLPIIQVIDPDLSLRESTANAITGGASAAILDAHSEKIASVAPLPRNDKEVYIGEGVMVNSGKYDGMNSVEFKKKIVEWLENHDKGKRAVNYKLRDWVFSRQRYWGEPIPIVHCEKCGNVAVPEKDLPLKLPQVKNYQPTGTGESPLASIKEWVNAKCPKCGGRAKRETNTMPQWAGSNWYFLRYLDPQNKKQLADPEKLKAWLPVDLYVGGAEHAVLHLLYARFIYKFLFDIGTVPEACGDEPFLKLKNQGLILAQDGQKMSKSRGNVINPDEVIRQYGADTMRMYEMFMGPFEDAKPWSTQGIVGVRRFLDRVWKIINKINVDISQNKIKIHSGSSESIHRTIQEITNGIINFRFNTCISRLMIFFDGKNSRPDWRPKLNSKGEWEPLSAIGKAVDIEALETFLKLLSPFAPHIAEELWQNLGQKGLVCQEPWPSFDAQKLKAKQIEIPIQINGKVRDKILVASDVPEAELKKMVLANVKIKKWLVGKPIKSFRYVRDRIISLAV